MARMLADQEVLRLFSAVYNNDLATVQEIVQGGLDPKHVQFVIQTDEICMCAAAFENLGLDFLEESLPANLGIAWPSAGQSDSGCVSEKDQSEDGGSGPVFHWLESGMCSHVTIRNQSDDMIIYESDEFEYESDDDLDKELDLEIYGIKVTPQPSLPGETPQPSLPGEYTPKSPHGTSPYSPHLHPPERGFHSVSPRNYDVISRDTSRELSEPMERLTLGDGEAVSREGSVTREMITRCMAPCPEDQSAVGSPAYLTDHEIDTPDLVLSSPRRQSVAEILAAAQSDTSGLITISPLVSPLNVSGSRSGGGQIEGIGYQAGVEYRIEGIGEQMEEVYEADVKFAGITPMHVASARGLDTMLEYLINQGCDVHVQTMDTEDSPLHLAIRWGHASTVRLLLRHGAGGAFGNALKYSPLDTAIESGNLECVHILLDHVTEMEEMSEDIQRALLTHSVDQDRRHLLGGMIEKFSLDVNSRCLEGGFTLLHSAATCGSLRCLELLVELGADLESRTEEGETALYLAAGSGNSACVKALLHAGAKQVPVPNWLLGDNQTPLMIAAYNNHLGVVGSLLMTCGDDEEMVRSSNNSDSHKAPSGEMGKGGDTGTSSSSKGNLGHVNSVSEYGDSALHYAATRGNCKVVVSLLEAGAAVNARNCYNATPLWNGVTKPGVLSLLLRAGAATDIPSTGHSLDRNESYAYETPKSPLEVALRQGCYESVRILLKHGCRTWPGITKHLDDTREQEDLMVSGDNKQTKKTNHMGYNSELKETITDIKRLITDPRPLRFLAQCFVRETVATNNVCSMERFNDIINELTVVDDDVKKDLLVSLVKIK